MAGNFWKWIELRDMERNGWKWQEWPEMTEYSWTWLDMARTRWE